MTYTKDKIRLKVKFNLDWIKYLKIENLNRLESSNQKPWIVTVLLIYKKSTQLLRPFAIRTSHIKNNNNYQEVPHLQPTQDDYLQWSYACVFNEMAILNSKTIVKMQQQIKENALP